MADKLARARLARAANALKAQSRSALPALVLMTDDERLADPRAAVRAIPKGSMVILRARDAERRSRLAVDLRPLTRLRQIKLLIADDAALAMRSGADGIHLPEARAREAARWRALHPGWIITAAAHALASTQVPWVDAIFLSPVFTTTSHPGAKTLGSIKLRLIARSIRPPVYALGGIDALTVRALSGARLAGIAAIGALAV